MMKNHLAASELVLNDDGSVYHLNLLPDEIADTVLLVGDPGRVERVSAHFDEIELKKQKREFVTHTGKSNGKRITVMSSGIGTENIDIVMNELDALANIDLTERKIKQEHKSLNIIRMGTCGSVNPDIHVDSLLVSERAVGLDGLMNFYPEYHCEDDFSQAFLSEFKYDTVKSMLYFGTCSPELKALFSDADYFGNTATLPGFYGPQGRVLRAESLDKDFLEHLNALGISNFEMETSAIYGLSKILGHKALTINCVIANRRRGEFSADHHAAEKMMIEFVLQRL